MSAPTDAADAGLAIPAACETMGDDDARVRAWDDLVAKLPLP